MFLKISKNVYSSFLKFVLITALIHIGILIIKSFKDRGLEDLNYFGILDLNTFFPRITQGILSNVLSIVVMATIFSAFLVWSFLKKSKQAE